MWSSPWTTRCYRTREEGPRAVIATLEEVFTSFRKHGIIASSKKLFVGSKVEFGDAIIIGGSEGVKIVPNPQRIQALREIRRPRSRKEVQIHLGTVRSLIKWFPSLNISTPNIGASILKGRIYEWN